MKRLLLKNAPGLLFMLLLCTVAAASIRAGMLIPATAYEQIGSGAFPMALGVLALALAVLKAFSFLQAARAQLKEVTSAEAGPAAVHSVPKALGAFVFIAGYFAALATRGVPYVLATSVFVFIMFLFVADQRRIVFLAGAFVACVIFSFIIHSIFTSFFYLDI